MNTNIKDAHSRFDRDVAWSAFAMLVPIVFGLAALPLIFRNVDEHTFTLFLLSYGAITFAPSLDLGVARTAQRRVAYATLFHIETQTALVRRSLKLTAFVSSAVGILATIGVAFLFPPQHSSIARFGLVTVTGMGVAIAIYSNCQRGILEGLGAFSRSALNRAGVGVMLVGAPVIVSFFVRDATALSLSALLVRGPFIWEQQRAISAALLARRAENLQRKDVITGFMRESGWFALLSVLAVAMSGFDRYVFIGWGLKGQDLAVFLAFQDLALRAISIPTALIPALAVRLAAGGGTAVTRSLSRRLFLVIIPGAVLGAAGAAALSRPIVHLLYPHLPNEYAASTLRLLLLGVVASAVAQFPMARLVAAGRARDAALMHLGEFALYLALVPALIHQFSALGAAALWSGRIVVDAVLLILWARLVQDDRSAMFREGTVLFASLVLIATIGQFA